MSDLEAGEFPDVETATSSSPTRSSWDPKPLDFYSYEEIWVYFSGKCCNLREFLELDAEIFTGFTSCSETFISEFFRNCLVLGTPSNLGLKKKLKILVQKMKLNFIFWTKIFRVFFKPRLEGVPKTKQFLKKTSELNVSERDVNPVKISASNSKNSRSYSIFPKNTPRFLRRSKTWIPASSCG